MFTIDEIKTAHNKVKSGTDFPNYIQELKKLGVRKYETFVTDGHTDYIGLEGNKITSGSKYSKLTVQNQSKATQFITNLKSHQKGETDYPTFCNDCANAGIEKWIADLDKMTCTYFSSTGEEILIEQIPQ
jgi:uncharacterized protein YbcV (DUF1398 family)